MRLYILRHGETDWNVRGMFYGWTDCDINEKGILQAEALGRFFATVEYDAIYSSDLLRAKHTAEIVKGEKADVLFETDPCFRELYFGDWEDKEGAFIRQNHKEALDDWIVNWKDRGLPGGEQFGEFYSRVTKGLERIISKNKGKTVLLVAHNGPISAILCHLTGAGPDGFWKFTALQGCYSSVLVSEKKTTIERLNVPI